MKTSIIDKDGFRRGVGIIVSNAKHEVLWAKRIEKEAWQFPQGGIRENETPTDALYRELEEETGLVQADVQLLGSTKDWLTYYWPEPKRLNHANSYCLGQKQKWFLLRLVDTATAICLDNTAFPEFNQWRWVDYWYPLEQVVSFKKQVYQKALHELVVHLSH